MLSELITVIFSPTLSLLMLIVRHPSRLFVFVKDLRTFKSISSQQKSVINAIEIIYCDRNHLLLIESFDRNRVNMEISEI